MALDVSDKIAIQELSSKYAIAMDVNDAEDWLATWDASGVWEGSIGKYEGHDRLRKLFADLGERIRGKRHVMTNFVIDGEGDNATQICYLLILDRSQHKPPGTAVYSDTLKKVAGVWRFVHRKVVLDVMPLPM